MRWLTAELQALHLWIRILLAIIRYQFKSWTHRNKLRSSTGDLLNQEILRILPRLGWRYMNIINKYHCLLTNWDINLLSSEFPGWDYMMLWYDLHQIKLYLAYNIAQHIVMMHPLRYKELLRHPQNRCIRKGKESLSHKYEHRGHFEEILLCPMDYTSSERLEEEAVQYLWHRCMISIWLLSQRIWRNDPWRRLSPNSIISSFCCSAKC